MHLIDCVSDRFYRGRYSYAEQALCSEPTLTNPINKLKQIQLKLTFPNSYNITKQGTHTFVQCLHGNWAHTFLAGQPMSQCNPLDTNVYKQQKNFICDIDKTAIPYSYVCDYKADCIGSSDEAFCKFKPCNIGFYDCGNGQVDISNLVNYL